MVSKQDSIKTAMSTETKTFHKDIKLAVEKGIKDNLDSIKAEIESRNEETEVTKPPSTTTDLGLQQKVRESLCEFLDNQARKTNLTLH